MNVVGWDGGGRGAALKGWGLLMGLRVVAIVMLVVRRIIIIIIALLLLLLPVDFDPHL